MAAKTERKFYSIKAQAGPVPASVYIYEQIGEDWWTGGGVQAKNLVKELAALSATDIDLHINSPGGDVFDGAAIYNAFVNHPARITTYIDGEAASIASVIALAGDKIVMAENALFMIHNPTSGARGDARALRKMADLLDLVKGTIVTTYMKKTNMTEPEVMAAMDDETWMNADEAVAFGFVDEVAGKVDIAACANFDHSKFQKAPRFINVAASAKPECCDDPEMEPVQPCEDCPEIDDCTNPNKDSADGADDSTEAPIVADNKEVIIMAEKVEGAAGAENRAAEIMEMSTAYGFTDKAVDWLKSGKSVDAVRKEILDLITDGKSPVIVPASEAKPIVDMTARDAKSYSYARAIAAAVQMREGEKPSGLEVEIHNEIEKKLPSNYERKGGILLPMRVRDAAPTPLTVGGTNTGAETVFQEYGEFIDILRNMMVSTRMGARMLTGLKGPITFPKQSGASSVKWVSENPGTDVDGSNVTFGTVSLAPKTMMGMGAISRQLITQSTPDVEGLVRDDLAMVVGLEADRVSLHGSSSNGEPVGLYNAAGLNIKAMGGVPTYGKLVDMVTAIAVKNALLGNVGFATTPGMAGKLMQTLESSVAGASWIWKGNHVEGSVAGYKAMASNQISAVLGSGNDEHGFIAGNWADMLMGYWGAMELMVDPYTLAGQGLLRIITFQMMDVALRRGESFTKATGAKIA